MMVSLNTQIQLTLNSTGIYFWYITLHEKHHMVGNGVGAYFGNAFSTLQPSDVLDGVRIGWFLTTMSEVTMINDEDYRYLFVKNDHKFNLNIEVSYSHPFICTT